MTLGSFALYRLAEALHDPSHHDRWADLGRVVREVADDVANSEYEEYMGEDL